MTTWATWPTGATRRRTVRAYAFDLLHFARWLAGRGPGAGGRGHRCAAALPGRVPGRAPLPGQPGGNVISIASGRASGYAPATINRRLAAISGLFSFRSMRDPAAPNPVPRGAGGAPRRRRGAQPGCWRIWPGPGRGRSCGSASRGGCPAAWTAAETAALLASFRTDRDRAIAGLMLLSGLRSAEVLGLRVADVDIGRGWVRVTGKGDKERRVPLDPDVAGLIQSYLLAERPETASRTLFVVAKGPHRGQPLTAAGLRTVFRYHRDDRRGAGRASARAAALPSAPPWPRPGWTWPVLQALMGHDHVDSSAAYIHLAPGARARRL